MKKSAFALLLIALSFHLEAQVSEGGLPPSYKSPASKSTESVAYYSLARIDTAALAAGETEQRLPFRYAVLEEVDIDIRRRGTRKDLSDGGRIWQFRINSPAARSVQVIFKKYLVPEGAQLFLYDQDYKEIRGAYTDFNMTGDLGFVTADFPGDHVIIEYYEPADARFGGEVIVGSVGKAYIDILRPRSGNTDSEGFIPVNCFEGISMQDQKHAVCKYSFNDSQYSYLCSGSLINVAGNSVRTYFLTAAHCINTEQEASTIIAYFNYEEAACSAIILYPSQTLSGSSLLTTGSQSDYSLLKFDRSVPFSYKPYFAGWDVTDSPPESSICIHHPGGKTKMIALDYEAAGVNGEILTWERGGTSPGNTHWAIHFNEGTTSSGSSGAPLFDQNKRITGQLHGGNNTDYFGKLSYSWQNPDSQYPSLRSFLDPEGTGVKTLDGFYPPGNLPDPQFDSQFSNVCTGTPIELKGFSAFEPLQWNWSFTPATVQYNDGTSSSSQSPKVSFLNDGNYRVTLRVTNGAGQDELTISNYINAGNNLSLRAFPSGLADSCIASFTGMTLEALGADAYLWTLSDNSDDLFYIVNNAANPAEIKVIEGTVLSKSTMVELTLTGIQGTCQSSIVVEIPLTAQKNDFIKKGIPISTGTSGPYSNLCATVEPGEPVPPFTDCTGQLSWCNEYGNGQNIVERSVWFTFTPEVNQTISLSSYGFDNQIAVYSASSATALLAGNYRLEAANDDYTETNANPLITSLDVMAGQKYWIQVDGSAGGATGTFHLTLSVLSGVEEAVTGEGLIVYPQPAADLINIESASFASCSSVRAELIDSAGRIVFSDEFATSGGGIQVPAGTLAPGVYLIRLYCNGKVSVVRVIV